MDKGQVDEQQRRTERVVFRSLALFAAASLPSTFGNALVRVGIFRFERCKLFPARNGQLNVLARRTALILAVSPGLNEGSVCVYEAECLGGAGEGNTRGVGFCTAA